MISVSICALLVNFLIAQYASAANWGTYTASYKNSTVVEGKGSFYNSAGTAYSVITTKDRKKDGNTVSIASILCK